MEAPAGGQSFYALGHSEQELQRLSHQGQVFGAFTHQLFEEAGISQGMRVLDVGSGSGDVAFLAADLVGPSGEVVGVDRERTAVDWAIRSRSTTLAPAPDLLHNERDNNEQRVENPDAHRCRLIGQWRARHIRIANLDHNQRDPEGDYGYFANCRHHIPREIKNYPASKERDL